MIVTITGRARLSAIAGVSLVGDCPATDPANVYQHYRKGDASQNNWGIHPIPRKNLKHQSVFMQAPEQAVILLAEDRDDDIVLIRRVFNKGNILNPLHVVRNGEEAIAYLKGEGEYSNRSEYPLPDLVLLDLKMPRVDGFEVLRWIRQQPELCALRVVVLTSSEEIRDVNLAYQLGANSFLVKPLDFERFVEISQALKGYWLWISKSPEIVRPAPMAPGPEKRIGPA